jgi:DNA-binding transcriptional LysR family regulator
MVVGCTVLPLFEALAAFHAAHPGVEVSLLEDASDRMVEAVRGGGLDLALVGAAALPEGLNAMTVVSEPLVAAVPAGHPLARRKRLALRELCAHPLVCMPPGTGLRTVLDRACAAQGLRPGVALEASAAAAVVDLAARGLGVAVLSESMAAAHTDRLIPVPLRDVREPALLALVWRDGGPAVPALMERLRRAFRVPD